MASLNSVTIIGNLGKDPELRKTQGGTSVCNFSVATSETWKDKTTGEKRETTEWHNIVVWDKQAESCAKYLQKGRSCCVQGSLQTRSYEKDGVKKYMTEIKADRVIFLNGGNGKTTGETTGDGFDKAMAIAKALKGTTGPDDDGVPF